MWTDCFRNPKAEAPQGTKTVCGTIPVSALDNAAARVPRHLARTAALVGPAPSFAKSQPWGPGQVPTLVGPGGLPLWGVGGGAEAPPPRATLAPAKPSSEAATVPPAHRQHPVVVLAFLGALKIHHFLKEACGIQEAEPASGNHCISVNSSSVSGCRPQPSSGHRSFLASHHEPPPPPPLLGGKPRAPEPRPPVSARPRTEPPQAWLLGKKGDAVNCGSLEGCSKHWGGGRGGKHSPSCPFCSPAPSTCQGIYKDREPLR